EPVAEAVAHQAAPRGQRQSCLDELGGGRRATSREIAKQRVAAVATRRREADPEAASQRLLDPALLEQPAAGFAGVGLPQHVLEVRPGAAMQLDDAAALLPGAAAAVAGPLQLDTRTIRKQLQRLAEIDPLDTLDEAEDVAALGAAEAVPGLARLA